MSAPKDKHRLKFSIVSRLLSYESETGILRWRVKRRYDVNAGDIAGAIGGDGYRSIMIDQKSYKAHRLAWLLHTGKWPKREIDHINRICDDNRIENLREATRSQNKINGGMYRTNKSGYRGVHFEGGKWVAQITRNKKRRYLGVFVTAREASNKFMEAANACVL